MCKERCFEPGITIIGELNRPRARASTRNMIYYKDTEQQQEKWRVMTDDWWQ